MKKILVMMFVLSLVLLNCGSDSTDPINPGDDNNNGGNNTVNAIWWYNLVKDKEIKNDSADFSFDAEGKLKERTIDSTALTYTIVYARYNEYVVMKVEGLTSGAFYQKFSYTFDNSLKVSSRATTESDAKSATPRAVIDVEALTLPIKSKTIKLIDSRFANTKSTYYSDATTSTASFVFGPDGRLEDRTYSGGIYEYLQVYYGSPTPSDNNFKQVLIMKVVATSGGTKTFGYQRFEYVRDVLFASAIQTYDVNNETEKDAALTKVEGTTLTMKRVNNDDVDAPTWTAQVKGKTINNATVAGVVTGADYMFDADGSLKDRTYNMLAGDTSPITESYTIVKGITGGDGPTVVMKVMRNKKSSYETTTKYIKFMYNNGTSKYLKSPEADSQLSAESSSADTEIK